MRGGIINRHQPTGFPDPPQFSRHQTLGGWSLFALLCWVLAASGCQSSGKAESLEERIKAFWDARVAGDDIKAYNYESYTKTGTVTANQYVRGRSPAFKYRSYEVKKIEEQGNEATVTLDLRYQVMVPTRGDLNLGMTRKEQWVKLDDGLWYHRSKEKGKKKASG